MVVSYIVIQGFGTYSEGDIIQLDDAVAQSMVDGGLIQEATEDDLNGGEDEAEQLGADDDQMMTDAVKGITKKLENAITTATQSAIKKMQPQVKRPALSVPAEQKQPIFKSQGDMLRALYKVHKYNDRTSANRLAAWSTKVPSGHSEGTNADGGYAVVPEWADSIWDKERGEVDLVGMCTPHTVTGKTINIPAINETARTNGGRFGGLQSYWGSEGDSLSPSKIGLTNVTLTVNKLYVFCFMTNELISDNAYNLDQYIQDKVGDEFLFKKNDAIVNGAGTTEPTGILNAAAKVAVNKESAQTAATINFANIAKMWGRLYHKSRAKAVWLANQEVEQQLITMAFTTGGTTPAHGLTYNVAEEFPLRLFGRPVHVIEACAALGNEGDLILCDPSQLDVLAKPMLVDVSTDYAFRTDETAYRFCYRMDAKSPWTAALTPYKGSATLSPFITLQSRGT